MSCVAGAWLLRTYLCVWLDGKGRAALERTGPDRTLSQNTLFAASKGIKIVPAASETFTEASCRLVEQPLQQ